MGCGTDSRPPVRPARGPRVPSSHPRSHSRSCTPPFPSWKWVIGRFSNKEWAPWGRSWWKWLFSNKETRSALIFSCKIRDRGPFLLSKWIIDHFSNKEWAKMLQNPRSGAIPSFKMDHWSLLKEGMSKNAANSATRTRWEGVGWDGIGRDRTGWDGMGRDGTGWDRTGYGLATSLKQYRTYGSYVT